MTLIVTAVAALVATICYLRIPAARTHRVGALALMYTGASLMWCVDGIAALAGGDAFVGLRDAAAMADDAALGACVVALGLAAWGVINLVRRTNRRLPSA